MLGHLWSERDLRGRLLVDPQKIRSVNKIKGRAILIKLSFGIILTKTNITWLIGRAKRVHAIMVESLKIKDVPLHLLVICQLWLSMTASVDNKLEWILKRKSEKRTHIAVLTLQSALWKPRKPLIWENPHIFRLWTMARVVDLEYLRLRPLLILVKTVLFYSETIWTTCTGVKMSSNYLWT